MSVKESLNTLNKTPKPDTKRTVLARSIHELKRLFWENWRVVSSLLVLAVLLGGMLVVHDYQNNSKIISSCGFRDDKTVGVGSQKIAVEVAKTAAAQQKGLGGRACIGQNEGMLFAFNQPGQYQFWMKDMKFPIDMIWISSSHKAVVVEEDVKPSTYPDRFVNPVNHPAQYVLELQAHASTRLGINPGTPIKF